MWTRFYAAQVRLDRANRWSGALGCILMGVLAIMKGQVGTYCAAMGDNC